jgi:hypothetical protein
MTIHELRTMFPRVYQQVFDAGVRFERKRLQAAELIGHANPDERQPAVFTFRSIQNALRGKRERRVRSSWVTPPRV